jgi:hypothetical protein
MSDAAMNETNTSAADLADQAMAVGKQAKDAGAEFAQNATETIKRQAADAAEAAKAIASEAGEKLQGEAMVRKDEAMDYVERVADAMRRAAGQFEPDLPIAASYIRSAAAQVDNVSTSVRNRDLKDLLDGAQSFARSQPTAFLGLTAVAGFALVRFLKSSSRSAQNPSGSVPSPADYH